MIKRETIEEILARTDIQSLVGGYVSLKRAGANVKGLCPFHSEKTPSFVIYPQNNSFFCFGCGAGGDQISFIMKMENLDYPDAVKFLAKRAGITVTDSDEDKHSGAARIDKNRILAINTDAAKFFHKMLMLDNAECRGALEYFTVKRRMTMTTIKHFGLGYAPDSFNSLLNYMLKKGYTRDELVAADLVIKNEKGHYYDAFRKRVIFPIIDVSGNVIAFGGRVLDDSKPKYRNSSDTPVYKKLRNLFALNFARHHCKEQIILCEGYVDVIALHAVGIENAVAALGTALTSEQARVLRNYTQKVLICYDSDEAGRKATTRAMKLLEEVGLEVAVISLSGAKDPDEYIQSYGVDRFREFLVRSKSKFEYNLDSILSKYDLMLPQDKIDALNELEKLISSVYSVAERDIYIQTVAKKFGVDPAGIKTDVDRMIARNTSAFKRQQAQKEQQQSIGYSDRINPDYIKAPAVAKNEENVLGLLLIYPEHRKRVFEEGLLSEDDFFTDLNKRIFNYVSAAFREGDDRLVSMSEHFSPDEMGRIAKVKISRMQLTENSDTVLLDGIKALKDSISKKKLEKTNTIDSLTDFLSRKREG
ncbi:MAG: DNA primase [Clostridia bacterium]|nr:DNA primase [Clostridia bacterium]